MQHLKQLIKKTKYVILLIAATAIFAGMFIPVNFAFAIEETNIFTISTAQELKNITSLINQGKISTKTAYYQLTADIDISELDFADGKGWEPIGFKSFTDPIPFAGVFDGAGYTVKGLWINRPEHISGAGLFGYNTGTIKNLKVSLDTEKGGIIAAYYAGGIVGLNYGTIGNCTVSGLITANYSGGITGSNLGVISDCFNYADISATSGIGGITGGNAGEINSCQNAGNITGGADSNDIGGIAGYLSMRGAIIKNCANYGAVSGTNSIGGIIGYAQNMTLRDCANYGAVSGDINIGGIAGYSSTNISNCLNTGEISGNENIGGIAGGVFSITIENCFYDRATVPGLLQNIIKDLYTIDLSLACASVTLISQSFLTQFNNGGSTWILRAPDNYHYYPELSVFNKAEFLNQYIKSPVPAYKGAPVLNKTTLTYGETLSNLKFLEDSEGEFYWQDPYLVLNAGENITAYAAFFPNSASYGELYDIEILITVQRAQSVLSVSLDNWKAGDYSNTPQITITAGELDESQIIVEYKKRGAADSSYTKTPPIESGKYTVRAVYTGSENYLIGYAQYDFSVYARIGNNITADLTWLIVLAVIVGSLSLIITIVYLTNKKFRYIGKIKKAFVREVIVEKPVIIEKPVYMPEINREKLNGYFELLTPREIEVANKILAGKSRNEIAEELFISAATTKRHIENILKKTDCINQKVFILKFMK